jgi:hypothetical protein
MIVIIWTFMGFVLTALSLANGMCEFLRNAEMPHQIAGDEAKTQ